MDLYLIHLALALPYPSLNLLCQYAYINLMLEISFVSIQHVSYLEILVVAHAVTARCRGHSFLLITVLRFRMLYLLNLKGITNKLFFQKRLLIVFIGIKMHWTYLAIVFTKKVQGILA